MLPRAATRIRAGVDEAGLGPILGPLCIGYSIFETPGGCVDLARALAAACVGAGAPLSKADARVRVCDSKLLHRGPRRMAHLERTALAFLVAANRGRPLSTVRDVFAWGVTDAGALAKHPWYRESDTPVPIAAERDDVLRAAERILRVCERHEIRILDLGTRIVPEFELNHLFETLNNKSIALFESILPLFARVGSYADRRPILVCDRHGARASYAPLLSKAFPGAWVSIAKEARRESLYRVRLPGGVVRVAFAEKGESRSFACALASCLAKYARELAMHRWNAYFQRIAPGVRPTAGYYTDGHRFLREAAPALRAAGIDPTTLTRTR
jgi:hypothetical protein